jgi:DNA-binding MarR family transcriptional regulator
MNHDVLEVQILYPKIYLACHTRHERAQSSEVKLSARDSSILAHLAGGEFKSQAKLAKHLSITPATLSETLARLVSLGYVSTRPDPDDERRNRLALTQKGVRALSVASVLDARKVERLLSRLAPKERVRAIEGLRLLANAARATSKSDR